MKWIRTNDDSSNLEDRRGRGGAGKKMAGGGILSIIIIAVALFMGKNPGDLLQMADTVTGGLDAGTGTTTEVVDPARVNENEEFKVFTLRVFNSCNEVWTKIFAEELGKTYQKPSLVLFTDQTTSGCGGASSAMGPFYCPADSKVYIDLNFFHELTNRFHAPGELAMAYVTAHEMGHHVQHLLGLTDRVHRMRGKVSEAEYNKLGLRVKNTPEMGLKTS